MQTNKKIIVFYHADCVDGAASAYIASCALLDDALYIPISYDTFCYQEYPLQDKTIFFLDFSVSAEILLLFLLNKNTVQIIDHHETTTKELQKLETFANYTIDVETYLLKPIVKMGNSGCVLTWQYFHKTPPPLLYLYIEDYDLFIKQYPNTEPLNLYLTVNALDSLETWKMLPHTSKMVEIGQALLKMKRKQVDAVMKTAFIAPLKIDTSFQGYICEAPAFLRNEVAEKLLQLGDKNTVACIVQYLPKTANYKVSLRSKNDIDVEVIAAKYGGGGHKQAASFYTQDLDLFYVRETIISYKKGIAPVKQPPIALFNDKSEIT